jgi:hypothetical protein
MPKGIICAAKATFIIKLLQLDIYLSQYLFHHLSYSFYLIQCGGLGIPENEKTAPGNDVAHSRFLVHTRYLVWLGLLSLHRLALAGAGSHGHPRQI